MILLMIGAAFLIGFAAFSRWYRRIWNKNLSLDLRFSEDGIFEGETGEIVETVTNAKLTPLLSASVSFRTPRFLSYDGQKFAHEFYREDSVSVFSYESLARRIPFTALRRGRYTLDDAGAAAIDPLFRAKYICGSPASCSVFVYPRVKGVENFHIDFQRLTGQILARRTLVEDPFFFRGVRDWTPADSMRHVNWNATAKTGALKVNQFGSAQSQNVLLLLDFDGYNKYDHEEIREDIIRIAAYLAGILLKSGAATGLVTNAPESGGVRMDSSCRNGRSQYFHLLRRMACIDAGKTVCPFSRILDRLCRRGPDAQCVLISYYAGPELDERVRRLSSRGTAVSWILLRDKSRRVDDKPQSKTFLCEGEY